MIQTTFTMTTDGFILYLSAFALGVGLYVFFKLVDHFFW